MIPRIKNKHNLALYRQAGGELQMLKWHRAPFNKKEKPRAYIYFSKFTALTAIALLCACAGASHKIGPAVRACANDCITFAADGETCLEFHAYASAQCQRALSHSYRSRRSYGSCEYANDGECDEPDLCARGTDGRDCR
jgi:hypothetical protein